MPSAQQKKRAEKKKQQERERMAKKNNKKAADEPDEAQVPCVEFLVQWSSVLESVICRA